MNASLFGPLAKFGRLNGPLPAFPATTPEGTAFWAGYALATGDPAGGSPPPARLLGAFRAGRRRKAVEPGIVAATDPRAARPAVPRLRP